MKYKFEIEKIMKNIYCFQNNITKIENDYPIKEFIECTRDYIGNLKQALLELIKNAVINSEILYENSYRILFNDEYDYDDSNKFDIDFKVYSKLFELDADKKLPDLHYAKTNAKVLTENYLKLFKCWVNSRNEFDLSFYNDDYAERYNKLIEYVKSKNEYDELFPLIDDIFTKINTQLGKEYAIEGLNLFKNEPMCYGFDEFEEWLSIAKKLAPNESDVLEYENCLLKAKIDDLKYELDECKEDEIDYDYRPVCDIANDILNDWANINDSAKPYLDAMLLLEPNKENYGQDSVISVISYFLANSSSYITDKSDRYKYELRNLLKIYKKH